MRYEMSQAELIEAVQFYLNQKVLKRPVTVSKVEPRDKSKLGINYMLHVTVTDDQEHIEQEFKGAARKNAA